MDLTVQTNNRPYHWFVFLFFCILLICLMLTVDFQQSITSFVGDLAVYLCMGQSFAHDFDCRYTRLDVARIFKDWGTCPSGVFLKQVGNEIYYAKPIIYPLFASPFVRFFDTNGFLLFNSMMLICMILIGFLYLRCYNSSIIALIFSSSFFLLQVGYVYAFTLVPEIFNMFLVTLGYFLWLLPEHKFIDLFGRHLPILKKFRLIQMRFWLGSIVLGMAAFSKLTNIILFLGPVLVFLFQLNITTEATEDNNRASKGLRYRFFVVSLSSIIFFGTLGGFFGLQYLFTKDFNPQGGYRKVFHHSDCPYCGPNRTFENGGDLISPDNTVSVDRKAGLIKKIWVFIIERAKYLPARMFFMDIIYFFIGRIGGLLPFFPMTILGLIVVCFERKRYQFVILFPVAVTALLFLIVMPQNYVGGAALGNRYFINSYPVFLFLFSRIRSPHWLWFPWIVGSLFLSPLILNPFQSNYHIGNFATRFPYTLLPLEQSLHANFPTNVNPKLNFIPFSMDPTVQHIPGNGRPNYNITFADHNTYGYEYAMGREGFWVRGQSKAEFIIRFPGPRFRMSVTIINGSVPNRITFRAGLKYRENHEYYAGQVREFSFELPNPFPYFDHSLLKCSVQTNNGFIPRFFEDVSSDDIRYLGCYVSIAVNPID